MGKLGAAILGTGWVANEHIKAYVRNPRMDVVALLSRDRQRGEAKVQEFGLDQCRVYTDLSDILNDERVSAVSICTPNDQHAEQAIATAEAGRHVLIEKPMALTMLDARHVVEAVRKSGVRSLVSFVLRWNPLVLNIRQMLDQGLLGTLYMAEVNYLSAVTPSDPTTSWAVRRSTAGSNLLVGGCHAIDAMRVFVGSKAVEVFAYSGTSISNRLTLEYNANSVTVIRFANGVIGTVICTLESAAPYQFLINLMGDKGSIRNNQVFTSAWPGQTDWATVPTILPDSIDVAHHPFGAEIDDFIACILEGREPACNAEDALSTHEIIFASERSAEQGRPVKLPLPD